MKKIDVHVNKSLFKFDFEPKSLSTTINDVIQQINQIKGFPNRAKVEITVDNQKRDRNFLIKDIQIPIIYVDFSDEIENLTIQHYSKDEEHKLILEKVDTCQLLSELEKQIAGKLACRQPYTIKIMKKNQFFDKNLLLCQIFIYQQEIFYVVLVKFYINHKNEQFLFQIDAFSHFDQIKQKVRQKFGIDEEINLKYQDKILLDQQTYFSQNIPDNVELILLIKTQQDIQVQYKNTNYKYSVSVNLTIKDLLLYFQQIYSIHENQKLQIKLNDKKLQDDIKIHNLDLSKPIVQFKLENQIIERPLQIKFEDKQQPQDNFKSNLSNLDFVSSIYELKKFAGKICEFFVDDQKLQITDNLIFEEIKFNNNNYLIQYVLSESQLINVKLQDEEKNIITIKVKPQDKISEEIMKKISEPSLRIQAFKQDQLLNLNGTYESEKIKDGDTIRYVFSERIVSVMITQQQEEYIRINYSATVKDLKQKVIQERKIKENFKILQDKKILNDNDYLKDFPKNESFRISREIQLRFNLILNNKIEQVNHKFYETDEVKYIKLNLKNIYEDEVTIVDEDNRNLNEDEEISTYSKKLLTVSRKSVDVQYTFLNSNQILEQKFDKTLNLGEMMKLIENRKSRCYIDNTLMDEYTLLEELIIEPQTVIIIERISRVQLIEQNNNFNKVEIEFYPEEIIDHVIKYHIRESAQLLFQNRLINKQNSFKNENIQDNDLLYYYYQLKIQFVDYEKKEFLYNELCNPNNQIKDIFAQRNFNKLRIYYQNKEINQDRTLAEEGVIDNSILEIQEICKNLKLHIDNDLRIIIVDIDMDIRTLKQKENLINNNYQIFEINNQEQALQDDVQLIELLNGNNEIELIYKLHENVLKIKLFDNERTYIEYTQQNTQIKTFIKEFENKYGLNNVSIFLEGEILNNESLFSQIPFNPNSEFEIVN